MSLQLIDTTLGAGDTGKAGGDKINQNTLEMARRLAPGATPIYSLFDGDSKYGEIKEGLKWAIGRYGLDVRVDGGDIGIGGSSSGNGANNLTNPTRMAATQATLAAHASAGHIVDYYLTMGTNDMTAGLTATQTMSNIRKFHDQVIRASKCVRYLMLMSVDPRAGAQSGRIHSLNRIYYAYARANPHDTIFVDTSGFLLDPAAGNTAGNPIPFATTAAPMPKGAVTADGLHCSNYGMYKKRLAIAPVARQIYRLKPSADLSIATDVSSPNATGANFLPGGRTVAIGGTQSITGGGGVTGTPPAGFTASGTLDGTAAITFSAATLTIANDGDIMPKGDWPVVRMAFSGTTGPAGGLYELKIVGNPDVAPVAGELFTAGALVNFNALAGAMGFAVSSNNGNINTVQIGATGVNTSPLATILADGLNGPHLFEGDDVPATGSFGGFFYSFQIYLPPNSALSGSLDIVRLFVERVVAIPAAAA